MSRKKLILSLIMNSVIVITTIAVVISYFFGNDGEYNIPPSFRFFLFTTDSNVLCMLSSLILIPFEIRAITSNKDLPKAAVILKYVGTSAVGLTFMVVILFLGPTMGYREMLFSGTSVYMHLCGPILAFVSFCFVENVYTLKKRTIPLAVIPAFIYGTLYLIEVIVIGYENGGWKDFYGFNTGGLWYLFSVGLILLSTAIAAAIRFVHNITQRSTHGIQLSIKEK